MHLPPPPSHNRQPPKVDQESSALGTFLVAALFFSFLDLPLASLPSLPFPPDVPFYSNPTPLPPEPCPLPLCVKFSFRHASAHCVVPTSVWSPPAHFQPLLLHDPPAPQTAFKAKTLVRQDVIWSGSKNSRSTKAIVLFGPTFINKSCQISAMTFSVKFA